MNFKCQACAIFSNSTAILNIKSKEHGKPSENRPSTSTSTPVVGRRVNFPLDFAQEGVLKCLWVKTEGAPCLGWSKRPGIGGSL